MRVARGHKRGEAGSATLVPIRPGEHGPSPLHESGGMWRLGVGRKARLDQGGINRFRLSLALVVPDDLRRTGTRPGFTSTVGHVCRAQGIRLVRISENGQYAAPTSRSVLITGNATGAFACAVMAAPPRAGSLSVGASPYAPVFWRALPAPERTLAGSRVPSDPGT
jgi:hypothetical protein